MRIKDLISEAPIDQFQTFNMDKEGTFRDQDKQMVTNPARVERARRFFENTPFVFDLFFVNLVGQTHLSRYKDMDSYTMEYFNALEKYVGRTLSPQEVKHEIGIDINYNPKAISVIYLSNAAEEGKVPLTPWMIAHRFTHTILNDYPGEVLDYTQHTGQLKSAIDVYESAVKEFSDIAIKYTKEGWDFSHFLNMKSVKSGLNITRSGIEELSQELLSEYIIKGRITFTIPKELANRNGLYIVRDYKESTSSYT